MNEKQISTGIRLVLIGMGVDPDSDANFRGTPARVAKMYKELLSPKKNSWATFPASSSDLVILRRHRVIALCPHHLMPVDLQCSVGYIPRKTVVGISKLARAVEEHLTKPMLQEDLAHAVADSLVAHLEPRGVGVVLTGVHGCMRFRGVKSEGDIVVSAMRGELQLNPTARSEFFQVLGGRENG